MPGSDDGSHRGHGDDIASDRWSTDVVFDSPDRSHAPPADLPSVMDRGVATAMDLRAKSSEVTTARTMTFGPMASRRDDGPDDFTASDADGTGLHVLRDPKQTAFRVVTIPETMAVRETERLVAKLREFDVPVTTLVVNKVIEDAGDCQRVGEAGGQHESIAALRESLPDLTCGRFPTSPAR